MIAWHIFGEVDHDDHAITHVWRPFVDHVARMHEQPEHAHRDWDQLLTEQLAVYGGHTDWNNEADPIWFPDEAHLAEFIMKWHN